MSEPSRFPSQAQTWIRGGRVVDPSQSLAAAECDLLIEGGRIAALGAEAASRAVPDAEVFEAQGLVLTPGLIEGRAHLGEPGHEERETLESGLRAAAQGGFTAVVGLPDTSPANDTRAVTEMLVRRAALRGAARLYPMAAVTRGLAGEELAEMGELAAAGAVAVGDADRTLKSSILRRALLYAQHSGLPVVHRASDHDLDDGGVMHEGEWSTRLGLPGCPAVSEESVVARDLLLAEETGGRYHLAPVTTAGSVERVRQAKARGLRVSCETTPHHLLLTDEAVATSGFDPSTRVDPPLRTAADAEALRAALADGTIDLVTSDHRPHHADHKTEVQFSVSPPGVVGLETTVGVCLDRLVHAGVVDLARLVELMSCAPARLFGLPGGTLAVGAPADITALDLERRWTVEPERFYSRGRSTPFAGEELRGGAVCVWVGGRRIGSTATTEAAGRG
ncbi:MAG: dihydroorotase [Acidobacteriota bacterium]